MLSNSRPKTNYPYEVLSRDVQEGLPGILPRIVIYDIYDYKEQYICYGEKLRHEQHIYIHGFEDIPTRPLCFVLLPRATREEIKKLVRTLEGRPLILKDGQTEIDIVNWQVPQHDIWSPTPVYKFTREQLVAQARGAIDMYLGGKEPLEKVR